MISPAPHSLEPEWQRAQLVTQKPDLSPFLLLCHLRQVPYVLQTSVLPPVR